MIGARDRALALRLIVEGRAHLPDQSSADRREHAQAASRVFRLRSAAVLSCPQAASISRPRGVRTGAEIPASNTMLLKDRIRSSVEHSYAAPGHGWNGIR